MPDPKRNAAIYYLEDGFNPQKGLNGRRMAGQSFLKGFFGPRRCRRIHRHIQYQKAARNFCTDRKKIWRIQAGQRLSKQHTTAVTSPGRDVYPYAELL